MLQYFSTLSKARRYAEKNCKYKELLIVLDKEAQEDCSNKYCVVDQSGINHLNQINWDYDIIEEWS